MVDQMGLIDQSRLQKYQRRSQPLSQGKSLVQPEMSSTPQTRFQNQSVVTSPVVKPTTQITDYQAAYQQQTATKTAPQPQSYVWQTTTASSQPSSNAEMFNQRKNALKEGQLYTRLKGNAVSTVGAIATQPSYEDWQQLLKQEAKSIAAGQGSNRLGVLVGDSLSMWFPSDLLPQGKLWLNQGISGENTSQILQRLGALDDVRAETIYVMAGVNDLKQGATDATVLNNSRAIIRRLKYEHPNATIVVQSLLPTRQAYLSPERAVRLNEKLQAIAQQEAAGYLNLHRLFVDYEGKMRADLTTDGIHLNRQGYEVWQQAMQQAENWVAARK
jgi:lysophospholipase L1-like esterase